MIIFNKKMLPHMLSTQLSSSQCTLNLSFSKLGEGYFFSQKINKNIIQVAEAYSKEDQADWSGFEYTMNKIYLEDELTGSIPEITNWGICLAKTLAERFKIIFPNVNVTFMVNCDEFSEHPSVALTFYVDRAGMMPLMPESINDLELLPTAVWLYRP